MTLKYATIQATLVISFEDDGVTELESQAIDAISNLIMNDDFEMVFAEVKEVGDAK